MWVDEAGFTKQDLITNVILPILEMMMAVLIMISTLVDTWNYLTILMNLKFPKTNETIFNVFQQTLICDRCLESDRPQDCRHKLHEIPPYKSAAKLDIVKYLYGSDVQLLQRESMGVIGESGDEIFARKWLKRLHAKEKFQWSTCNNTPPRLVFVGCDPNAGGKNETAVVAVVNCNGMTVIVGMESWTCEYEERRQKFKDFIESIRAHPWLKRAWIIYIGESNTGDVSAAHASYLKELNKTHCLRDKEDRMDPGVWTDKNRKRDYKTAAQSALCRDSVLFMEDMIVFPEKGYSIEDKRAKLEGELMKQFSRARPTCANNTSDTIPGFQSWSAKLDGQGKFDPNANDDIVFAFCMVVYWMGRFITGSIDTVDYQKFSWM